MKPHSLQWRVTLAVVAIVGGVCALSTVATLIASDRLEDSLLREITNHEADNFLQEREAGVPTTPPNSAYLHAFVVAGPADPQLPRALAKVPPGHHDGVAWDSGVYHVYRKPIEDGWLYLAYDITAIESREITFQAILWLNVALAVAFAGIAGLAAARLTLTPLRRLARRVRGLPAETRGLRLSDEFATAETAVIAGAFDRYLARLDRLIEREQAFTTDASHELRTPLAVIRSTAELVQSRVPEDGQVRKQVERIRAAAEQMTELTESLLMLARDSEAIETEYVHLESVLVDICNGVSSDAAENLRLDADSDASVRAPAAAVRTVMHNLVHNALRHAAGAEVTVTLRQQQLAVIDRGPGMPADVREYAFDRGFQSGPSAGLGFGLYICKRLCERFGWQIRLTAAPEGGTRVTVRF